eukprot:Pompholyxophrys_punicea_v1_NODE_246_length_2555_cov_67.141762.p2 type:complete len:100 gc:universal NODE_246_length_2555_cov_67.141762:1430-1729(+)
MIFSSSIKSSEKPLRSQGRLPSKIRTFRRLKCSVSGIHIVGEYQALPKVASDAPDRFEGSDAMVKYYHVLFTDNTETCNSDEFVRLIQILINFENIIWS